MHGEHGSAVAAVVVWMVVACVLTASVMALASATAAPPPPTVLRAGAAPRADGAPMTALAVEDGHTRDATRRVPTSIRIDDLGVEAAVLPRGTRPESDQFDLPADAVNVAWYEPGPAPGQDGSAVLAAHVDYGGRAGVFFGIGRLAPGASVVIGFADGGTMAFQVVEIAEYPKAALPVDELFHSSGPPVLTLVTCGGEFDRSTRRYRQNTVVRAVTVP